MIPTCKIHWFNLPKAVEKIDKKLKDCDIDSGICKRVYWSNILDAIKKLQAELDPQSCVCPNLFNSLNIVRDLNELALVVECEEEA